MRSVQSFRAAFASIALLVAGPVHGQGLTEQFVIDRFTIRDGLPVNSVNALHASPDGYLWLATFGGLVRFDGLRFTTFTAGNTPGIPSDRVGGLNAGGSGAFYFSTERYDLVRATRGHFDPIGRFEEQTWDVLEEGDSLTWIGTGRGLFRFRFSAAGRDSLEHVPGPPGRELNIRDLLRDRRGRMWVTDREEGGIWRYEAGGWSYIGSVPSGGIGSLLYEDEAGGLWASGRGLVRILDDRVEAVALAGIPTTRNGFQVRRVTGYPAGGLLLITTIGVFRVVGGRAEALVPVSAPGPDRSGDNLTAVAVCPSGRVWTHRNGVLHADAFPVVTSESVIQHMACDHEDNVWVAMADGLMRIRRAEVHSYGREEGLGVGSATNVLQDAAGAIIVSGIDRTYDRLTGEGNVATFEHDAVGAPFFLDSTGALWHGTWRCDPGKRRPDGSCTDFEQTWPRPGQLMIRSMGEDRYGTLWAGTLAGVLWRKEGRWLRPATEQQGPKTPVRHFLEARDGTIYLATFGEGIARIGATREENSGRFSYVTTADGLSSDNIRGLHEGPDGEIWIATEDRGLNRYDPRSGRVTVIRQADGLYSDGLHQVLSDDYGRMWMSSNQGIFWVRSDEVGAFVRGDTTRVSSVFYVESNGMRNREANGGWQNSAMKSSDGRLWFATQAGVSVIDPAAVEGFLVPSPVIIEQIETSVRRAVAIRGPEVELEARERTFRVAYTAINFTSPTRMRFRYRLVNYDDSWIQAGNRREATYTRVPPGRYRFEVMASNGDGLWTSSATPITVVIAPYFYETPLFRGALLFLAFGLLWLVLQVRTRSLIRRRRQLEAEVAQRTGELEAEKKRTEEQGEQLLKLDRMKSRFFTNVSHEFRTPLTLTIGPLEDLRADPDLPETVREGVDLALTNSRRILRLINQLLDVARLEAGEMRLSTSRADVAGFVRTVAEQFVRLLERKGIHFEVQVPAGPVPVYFDAEKLEQVVVNLLSNAFKFTAEGGAISVSVSSDTTTHPGAARIVVRDTGSGIAPDLLPHIFDRFYQADESQSTPQGSSGIGLSLVKDLVELHAGSITVESTLRFGSTFTVLLPLGREHLDDDQIKSPHAGPDRDISASVARQVAALDDDGGAAEEGPSDADDRFTVLVADDNADIRAYIRRHMEAQYRVLEAANGSDALEMVRRSTPDLVVSDIMMPVLDGLGLVTAIRADRDTDFIPVVMLTAKATEEDLFRGLEVGADAYLTKPFSMRELQLRIDGLIASRQRLQRRDADRPKMEPESNATAPAGANEADHAFLTRVNEAIEAHLSDEHFDVQGLADALRMSRNTIHRRLRAVAGIAPSEALRRARLARAAALLGENEGNVSEIAYAVGFKSVSYFSYCFREVYGVTPSTYSWRSAGAPASPRDAHPQTDRS